MALSERAKPVEVDVESFFSGQVNEDQIKKVQEDLLVEAGTWRTVPQVALKGQMNEHSDYPKGRPIVNCVTRLVSKDGEKQAVMRFNLAPEAPAKNAYGKWDRATILWNNVVAAAKKAGLYDGTVGSVLGMVRDYALDMRIIRFTGDDGEPRNVVMSLSLPRE